MVLLDSDLNDAGIFTLVPSALYNAHIVVVEITKSRALMEQERQEMKKYPPNMAILDWLIDEGHYSDRKIRFNNVMLGGFTKDGKPMPLGGLCSLINYAGIPWECKRCHSNFTGTHSFYIATNDDRPNGLSPGNYYCSACKNKEPGMLWETNNLMGARCGISVGSRKSEDNSKEFNEVRGYADLLTNPS